MRFLEFVEKMSKQVSACAEKEIKEAQEETIPTMISTQEFWELLTEKTDKYCKIYEKASESMENIRVVKEHWDALVVVLRKLTDEGRLEIV